MQFRFFPRLIAFLSEKNKANQDHTPHENSSSLGRAERINRVLGQPASFASCATLARPVTTSQRRTTLQWTRPSPRYRRRPARRAAHRLCRRNLACIVARRADSDIYCHQDARSKRDARRWFAIHMPHAGETAPEKTKLFEAGPA